MMPSKLLQTVVIFVLIIGMSGCGFKLRGSADPLPAQIRQMALVGIDKGSELYRSLSDALIGAGATLDESDGADEYATLTIHNVAQSLDEISESGGETLYRANFAVTFSLSRGENKLINSRQLRASREFSFDSNNPYGLEQQDLLLRNELKRDLFQQLIRQIRAAGLAESTTKGTTH